MCVEIAEFGNTIKDPSQKPKKNKKLIQSMEIEHMGVNGMKA